jgi:hypothetical protein
VALSGGLILVQCALTSCGVIAPAARCSDMSLASTARLTALQETRQGRALKVQPGPQYTAGLYRDHRLRIAPHARDAIRQLGRRSGSTPRASWRLPPPSHYGTG